MASEPLTIALGSISLHKIKAVQKAFEQLEIDINLIPCNVESGVSKQPVGLAEIIQGANNRAQAAHNSLDISNFGIGIEGGIIMDTASHTIFNMACVYIIKGMESSHTLAPTIEIPYKLATQMITEGKELGDMYGTKGIYEAITKNRVYRWEADAIAIRLAYSQRW
jgi:inosine/xanthosine triphosphatase